MQISRTFVIVFIALILFGCASQEDRTKKELRAYHHKVEKNLSHLEKHLKSGRIRNAVLLEEYASLVKRQKPEYKRLISALEQDASSKGPMYQSLIDRLEQAEDEIPDASRSLSQAQALVEELNAINTAAQPRNYNMALSDPLNVLADMSDGKLARVADLAGQAASNKSQATGSELIGNPNYGQWRTDSSGNTFWEWYGKYALISTLFNMGNHNRYDYWSSNRRPSFYHDYGRDYYSSPKQKRSYQKTETRVKKQFSQNGRKFQSPYAKKTNSTTASRKPYVKQPSKFKSAYSSSKNTYSSSKPSSKKFNSSYNSRSSKSSSRSFGFGGK